MPAVPNKSDGRPVRKSWTAALLLCLLAALAAAFAFSAPLQAQEGTEYEYVDLLLLYEQSPEGSGNASEVAYTVLNSGTATATGVTVEFLLEEVEANDFALLNTVIAASVTGKETVDSTNERFTWVIGTILPGESSESLIFSTSIHSGHTTADRIGVINATASANQPEPGKLSDNNVIKAYTFVASSSGATKHMSPTGRLNLLLSVDDLQPDAGDDLNFDLTANQVGGGRHWVQCPHRRYRY